LHEELVGTVQYGHGQRFEIGLGQDAVDISLIKPSYPMIKPATSQFLAKNSLGCARNGAHWTIIGHDSSWQKNCVELEIKYFVPWGPRAILLGEASERCDQLMECP